MNDALILFIGAADTGRAPMAAALLRRLLRRHDLRAVVASAGVVGHDDDPAEPEARDAMLALGIDIGDHAARSLSDALVAEALLLIAVEAGVARAVRSRYPDAEVITLGGLAGRARDIPDPFRMQVGAWMHYAGEIEALLTAGLPRIRALLDGAPAPAPASPAPPPAQDHVAARQGAVERAVRLLSLAAELPDVLDWDSTSRQIASDLAAMEQPLAPDDLARPYVALVRAMLALTPSRPTASQAAALRAATARLSAPIGPAELDAASGELGAFGGV
jgi:protein-tyrosine phosphatase